METVTPMAIVALCLCVILVLFVWLVFAIRKQYKLTVSETSKRFIALSELNRVLRFDTAIQTVYSFPFSLNSKQQFDHFQYDVRFERLVEQEMDFFADILFRVTNNINLLAKYQEEMKRLPPLAPKSFAKKNRIPYVIYHKMEKKLLEQITQRPVVNPSFVCEATYVSPQGRNSYQDQVCFSFQDLIFFFDEARGRMAERESKQYQRKAMTSSLRYDIMKRDGFRCTLCGRTAAEGAKLHVDHILPVSRGGKTVADNLRTLCQDCNLGKSDKYDPNGCN